MQFECRCCTSKKFEYIKIQKHIERSRVPGKGVATLKRSYVQQWSNMDSASALNRKPGATFQAYCAGSRRFSRGRERLAQFNVLAPLGLLRSSAAWPLTCHAQNRRFPLSEHGRLAATSHVRSRAEARLTVARGRFWRLFSDWLCCVHSWSNGALHRPGGSLLGKPRFSSQLKVSASCSAHVRTAGVFRSDVFVVQRERHMPQLGR